MAGRCFRGRAGRRTVPPGDGRVRAGRECLSVRRWIGPAAGLGWECPWAGAELFPGPRSSAVRTRDTQDRPEAREEEAGRSGLKKHFLCQ